MLIIVGSSCALDPAGTTSREHESAASGGPGAALAALLSDPDGSLEDVLDLLAGLLGVAGRLVLVAFGLQVVVVGGLPERFLALSRQFLGLVLQLVRTAHDEPLLGRGQVQVPNLRAGHTNPAREVVITFSAGWAGRQET